VRKTRCIEIARNLFVETCTCAAFMHRRKHAEKQAKRTPRSTPVNRADLCLCAYVRRPIGACRMAAGVRATEPTRCRARHELEL
jgi:hypothetical protein